MIVEIIITTVADDGAVNCAPMGVEWSDTAIVLKPFLETTTYRNVVATGAAVVNLIDDVRVFARAAIGNPQYPTTPAIAVGGAVPVSYRNISIMPANITVKQGDGIKFVVVSGGPHNVAFDPATIPADVKPQLDANMGTDKMGELSSNMKTNAGESVTVSFAKIKPGQYPFHCVPHLALNMKGVITVQ